MSITISTDVFCDVCLSNWIHGAIGHKVEARHARKTAGRAGWARWRAGDKMLDACPECVEKRVQLGRKR